MTFKNFSIITLVHFGIIVFVASARNEWGSLSIEEDSKVNERLKAINKPAIKSFKIRNGDIVDCVDIYKQLAFDHPLLKNHTIQGAVLEFRGKNYGTSASLNTWSLNNVGQDQHSSAYMAIVNGVGADYDALKVGWIVYPDIFRDTDTRLYTYWLGKLIYGTQIRGCYNINCPGFVQVSREVFLGSNIYPTSKYNGIQYQIDLNLYQDTKTGNWWLQSRGHDVGYWPRSVFHFIQDGAEHSAWGGETAGPRNRPSAPMGNGHFPSEGFKKSAYISNIKVRVQNNRLIDPAGGETYTSNPYCYDVKHYIDRKTSAHFILHGGPGNCKE